MGFFHLHFSLMILLLAGFLFVCWQYNQHQIFKMTSAVKPSSHQLPYGVSLSRCIVSPSKDAEIIDFYCPIIHEGRIRAKCNSLHHKSYCSRHTSLYARGRLWKNEAAWNWESKNEKGRIPGSSKAYKAVFWSMPNERLCHMMLLMLHFLLYDWILLQCVACRYGALSGSWKHVVQFRTHSISVGGKLTFTNQRRYERGWLTLRRSNKYGGLFNSNVFFCLTLLHKVQTKCDGSE